MLANQIQSCIKYTVTKSHCFRNAWLATLINQIIKVKESYDFSQELQNKHSVKSNKYPFIMRSILYKNSYQRRNKRELPNPTEGIYN